MKLPSLFALIAALTLFGGPTRATAQAGLGHALKFDGNDDRVQLANVAAFPATNITVEFWMRSSDTSRDGTPFSYATPASDNTFLIFNYKNFVLYVNGQSVATGIAANDGFWQHIAVTWRSSDGALTLYRNGTAVFQTNLAAGQVMPAGGTLVLGQEQDSVGGGFQTTQAFQGELDEVRIWNAVRSATDITNHMFQPLTGTEPGLVAYYRFDEGAGIRAYDATTNRLHATLINRPVRAPSYWWPVVTLNSPNPMTNECHVPFVDPTTVNASALAMATRQSHSLALRADGSITGWGAGMADSGGYPNYGQASVPARATNVVAIAVNELASLALKADGTVVVWGANFSGETNVPAGATTVVAIAAGREHNLALRANGTVIGWGANWHNQTTIPAGATNVVAIAAGDSHSLALRANGTVVGWGNNNSGQTTIPPSATNVVAIAAGDHHSLALRANGTVVGWGNNYSGQTTIPAGATNVVAIVAGASHSLILRADGSVLGWGYYYAAESPADATNVVAIAAGPYSSVAFRADGMVVVWGYIHSDDIPLSVCQVNLPLAVSGAVNPNALGVYGLAYSTTNTLGVIGTASRTVVVADRLPPILTLIGDNPLIVSRDVPFVDPGATAMDLCTGDLTGSIVSNITVNSSVPGIYTNTFRVTDASGNVANATRTVVVAAPLVTTLPVSDMINDVATLNGTVNPNGAETTAWFEWRSGYGSEYAGRTEPQSLDGETNPLAVTATVSGLTPGVIYRYRVVATNSPWVTRGQEQVFWSPAVDLHGPVFLTLQHGASFTDATTVHAYPQAIAAGATHSLALKAEGRVVGWGASGYGQTNAPGGATNVVAIAGGGFHSLALKADGRVVGWGASGFGQTNAPGSATNVVAIAAGGYHSLALRADGRVIGWGRHYEGQTNSSPSATNVVAIAAGGYHSLALRADGTVVGWGAATNNPGFDPDHGQAMIPPGVTNVVAIAAGEYHSLALRADGTVVGWGAGTFVADPEDYDYANFGQVVIPASATNVVAIAAGGFHSLALRADGTVVGWGDNYHGQTTVPAHASNVVAIAAGGGPADGPNLGHSLALRADGTVVGWGAGGPGSSSYPHFGQSTIPPGLSSLSLPLVVTGSVNTNVLGTYVLNYHCTNALGAIGTATRTVVIATLPIVTTESATGLGTATPRLQGTVNPRASETLAWFEYGLGANYGVETPKMPIGNLTNAQPINWPVPGLLPWLTYHYRAAASNALGRTDGVDVMFTVPGPTASLPSLSVLPDVTLTQGGNTYREFTVAPAGLEVRVRGNNSVLLPEGSLVLGGTGNQRWLSLAPNPNHSGLAQVTVTASDGTRTVSETFNLTVTPVAGGGSGPSSLLYLTNVASTSPQAWRFRIVDAGTGATNYAVEYRPDLSPTNQWGPATNVTLLGGGVIEVATGPPPLATGFYRVAGFGLPRADFSSPTFRAEEGASAVGPVLVFNGVFTGTVNCTWSDDQGNTWTQQVQVNGTTAVVPIPASLLSDNAGINRLRSLTLQLEAGSGFALGANTQSTITIEDNDAEWSGVVQTPYGTLGFELTLVQTHGSLQGHITSESAGFFPTSALVQITRTENAFTAVATNIPLPTLTGYPSVSFTNSLDLRLDAVNQPGVTNVRATKIEGVATLANKVPNRTYLDAAITGPFLLVKPPAALSTNDVPLYPAP